MRMKVLRLVKSFSLPEWLRWSLKAVITALALWYVVGQIQAENIDWRTWWQDLSGIRFWALALATGLVSLNLYLEVAKWQLGFQHKPGQMPRGTAWNAVLVGVGLGLFTPNRWGEYAGRLWELPPQDRWQAGFWTWLGRMAQMLCTCLLGLVCLYGLLQTEPVTAPQWWHTLAGWGHRTVQLVFLALIGLTLGSVMLPRFYRRIPLHWVQKLGYRGEVPLFLPSPKILLKLLGLSALRYGVFAGQYVLLLWACGTTIDLYQVALLVGLVFLVKSFFPTVALAELGVRESVALTIMGLFGMAASTAVIGTLLLFLINLALPGMLGIFCLYSLRRQS